MPSPYNEDHPYASSINALSGLLTQALQSDDSYEFSYEIDYTFGEEFRQIVLIKLKEYSLDGTEIREDTIPSTSIVTLEADGLEGLSRIIRFDKDMTEIIMLDIAAQLRIEEYDYQIKHPIKVWFVQQFGFKRTSRIPTTVEITDDVNQAYSVVRSALSDN